MMGTRTNIQSGLESTGDSYDYKKRVLTTNDHGGLMKLSPSDQVHANHTRGNFRVQPNHTRGNFRVQLRVVVSVT